MAAIPALDAKPYVIRRGDTLDGIANAHGELALKTRTRAAALENIDARIRDTDRLLQAMQTTIASPLPLK